MISKITNTNLSLKNSEAFIKREAQPLKVFSRNIEQDTVCFEGNKKKKSNVFQRAAQAIMLGTVLTTAPLQAGITFPPEVLAKTQLNISMDSQGNQIILKLNDGIPELNYLIQTSTDLKTWTPLITVRTDEEGKAEIATENKNEKARFFRATLQIPEE